MPPLSSSGSKHLSLNESGPGFDLSCWRSNSCLTNCPYNIFSKRQQITPIDLKIGVGPITVFDKYIGFFFQKNEI